MIDSQVSCCCSCKIDFSVYKRKICQECAGVAYLVAYSLDAMVDRKCQAASGLTEWTAKGENLDRLVTYGGVDALIGLSECHHREIEYFASGAIYNLARHGAYQAFTKKNIIEALVKMTRRDLQHSVLLHIASTFYLLSVNNNVNNLLGIEKVLEVICQLCTHDNQKIAELAAKALTGISSNEANRHSVIYDKRGALKRILRLLLGDHCDVIRSAAKSLAYLSMAADEGKKRVTQMDTMCHGCLATMIRSSNDPKALTYAACAIANLAAIGDAINQALIWPDNVASLGIAAGKCPKEGNLQRHVARGFENFALHKHKRSRIVSELPAMMSRLVTSPQDDVHMYTFRAIENLIVAEDISPSPSPSLLLIYQVVNQQVLQAASAEGKCQLVALRILKRIAFNGSIDLSDKAHQLLTLHQSVLADLSLPVSLPPASPASPPPIHQSTSSCNATTRDELTQSPLPPTCDTSIWERDSNKFEQEQTGQGLAEETHSGNPILNGDISNDDNSSD
eukprot:Ihof_evm6s149 gene=Ihof_evmTU6s149